MEPRGRQRVGPTDAEIDKRVRTGRISKARTGSDRRVRTVGRQGGLALLAGVVAAAALSAVPAGAAVGGGRSIEVFTGSNLVGLSAYPPNTDVRVEVVRQGFVIGSAVKTTDATGAIEMNHVGGTDCFDGPTSPDIMPGDTLRTTILPTGAVDSSLVRGVFIDSLEISDATNEITVSGRVTVEGPAAVAPGADILELRINKGSDNTWELNDRPGRTDLRVDIGADVDPGTGRWQRRLPASQDDIDDLRANGFEHFLEWSAGAAAGEEEEAAPSELTVWDEAGGEAIDCPPLQRGPTAPQLDAAMDSGAVGDHVTNRSTALSFGGLTGEAGPNATVTLFVDGEPTANVTADADGVYSFTGIGLTPRQRPYALRVRAQGDGGPFFDSEDRMVTVDAAVPRVKLRRFAPDPLRLAGPERVQAVYRVGEGALLQARVQRRLADRVRTVRTLKNRRRSGAGRLEYTWNGRNEIRRNVRPGRYQLVLTVTDQAGNVATDLRRFRVVRAEAPSRPRIRRAFPGARGGRDTATATWARPLSNNGARVLGYRMRALRLRPNGPAVVQRVSRLLGPRTRSHRMRLQPGRYRFQVKAMNTVGASRWSARSDRVRSR